MTTATAAPSQWTPITTARALGIPARTAPSRVGPIGSRSSLPVKAAQASQARRTGQPAPVVEEAVREGQGQHDREDRDRDELHQRRPPEDPRAHRGSLCAGGGRGEQ